MSWNGMSIFLLLTEMERHGSELIKGFAKCMSKLKCRRNKYNELDIVSLEITVSNVAGES